jgi:hypothetical protein
MSSDRIREHDLRFLRPSFNAFASPLARTVELGSRAFRTRNSTQEDIGRWTRAPTMRLRPSCEVLDEGGTTHRDAGRDGISQVTMAV